MYCPSCSGKLFKNGNTYYCPNCGVIHVRREPMDWGAFIGGIIVGTFLIAPFIWTAVGRELAVKTIAKGAKVTEAKVREWLKG